MLFNGTEVNQHFFKSHLNLLYFIYYEFLHDQTFQKFSLDKEDENFEKKNEKKNVVF